MISSYGEVPTAFSSVSTPWVSTAFSSVTTTSEPKGYGVLPFYTADVDVDGVDDVHDDVDEVDSSFFSVNYMGFYCRFASVLTPSVSTAFSSVSSRRL